LGADQLAICLGNLPLFASGRKSAWRTARRPSSGLARAKLVKNVMPDDVHFFEASSPARPRVIGVIMRRAADIGQVNRAGGDLVRDSDRRQPAFGSATRRGRPSQAKENWHALRR